MKLTSSMDDTVYKDIVIAQRKATYNKNIHMTQDIVKLLGFWASPFALRVKWALSLKGIEYEYIEEDLSNKSSMLLQYNPMYKKVPVLLHNGKPIIESLVIIEYIEDMWKNDPLLPEQPLERARSRVCAKFVDDKVNHISTYTYLLSIIYYSYIKYY